jgi:hypothetical protein
MAPPAGRRTGHTRCLSKLLSSHVRPASWCASPDRGQVDRSHIKAQCQSHRSSQAQPHFRGPNHHVCHNPLIKSGPMNRHALEVHAREKHQNSVAGPSRQISMSTSARRLGFLRRNPSQPKDYESTPTQHDSMTFLYRLRCDLVEIDLEEILPMIK